MIHMERPTFSPEVERLASRPYRLELIPDADGTYTIRVPDLPGCMSEGADPNEAVRMIEESKRVWIEAALESGCAVADPSEPEYRAS